MVTGSMIHAGTALELLCKPSCPWISSRSQGTYLCPDPGEQAQALACISVPNPDPRQAQKVALLCRDMPCNPPPCRAGVGAMTIVDGDTVDFTNKNRQLVALGSTVGRSKVAVMAERLLDINPDLKLQVRGQGGLDFIPRGRRASVHTIGLPSWVLWTGR